MMFIIREVPGVKEAASKGPGGSRGASMGPQGDRESSGVSLGVKGGIWGVPEDQRRRHRCPRWSIGCQGFPRWSTATFDGSCDAL